MADPTPALPATNPPLAPDAAPNPVLAESMRPRSLRSSRSSRTVDVTEQAKSAGEEAEKVGDEATPRQNLEEGQVEDVIWVTWDGPDDPANPFNWSRRRKWTISLAGIVFCGMVSIGVSSYAVNLPSITRTFHVSREVASLGITLFTLTFGTAPLLLAPLSEVFGRNMIYFGSAVVYALFFIPQAVATNIETILICRFISGMAGSTGVTLVGGTLADVWRAEERGFPMSLFAFSAFASTGLGPIMFGYVEQNYGFRLTNWILFGFSGAFAVFLLVILHETRASVLLAWKAARLRKETGDERYRAKDALQKGSFKQLLYTSLTRPIRMLFTEIVLFAFAFWIGFVWSILYILLESFAPVFSSIYGFNTGESGLVFVTQIIGSCIGLAIDKIYCDKMYLRNVAVRGPEARLYTALIAAFLVPVGCLIYTFTSYSFVTWVAPCIGVTILFAGMFLVFLACFNYLVETYTLFASSAMGGQNALRNSIAAVAPLFTTQMYAALGVQGAGGLITGIAIILSATPFLLFKFGPVLRKRSPFASQLASQGNG